MEKQIIIVFTEKDLIVNLKGNPTRNEILGSLELVKETLLDGVKIPINEIPVKTIKRFEKRK